MYKLVAIGSFIIGILSLLVNSWNHNVLGLILGVGAVATSVIFAKLWCNGIVRRAEGEVRLDQLDARFKIADQTADMIASLLQVTRPHLKVVKTPWGKSEDGRYSGVAVDVTDPVEGEWWINIESTGRTETWIGAPLGSIQMSWGGDQNKNPAYWPEILSSLVARKKRLV